MLQNLRIGLRKRQNGKSDAPAETRGGWQKAFFFKLKEKDKASFFSPTMVCCLPAPSVTKPEEREFVEYSGA